MFVYFLATAIYVAPWKVSCNGESQRNEVANSELVLALGWRVSDEVTGQLGCSSITPHCREQAENQNSATIRLSQNRTRISRPFANALCLIE